MPVRRTPFFTFQYVTPTGSSVPVSFAVKSWGACGNIPCDAADGACSGKPWQKAQLARYTSAPAAKSPALNVESSRSCVSFLMRACNAPRARNFSKGIGESDAAAGACPVSTYKNSAIGTISNPRISPTRNPFIAVPFFRIEAQADAVEVQKTE